MRKDFSSTQKPELVCKNPQGLTKIWWCETSKDLPDFFYREKKDLTVVTNSFLRKRFSKNWSKKFILNLSFLIFEDSEAKKNLSTIETLAKQLVKIRTDRHTELLAMGGGVIGDMTGFLASIFMRGISFSQIPTTLLAMVDSSCGGKTGVDLKEGKNLLGTFHHPKNIFLCPEFLSTLAEPDFIAGLAEVIKYGMIFSESFFDFLQKNCEKIRQRDPTTLKKIILKSLHFKAAIVAKDATEKNQRALLNFGHTYGHALEAITRYQRFRHGEAVALGMLFATRLASHLKLCDPDLEINLRQILKNFGLPLQPPRFSTAKILQALQTDKKNQNGKLRFVLPQKIGKVSLVTVDEKDVRACLEKK